MLFITWGQYWPLGIVVACVRPSVTKFVRTITHHPFKLGSPNLDHRCKRPWLRSLLFWGGDWPWTSRLNLTSKSKFAPFWACPRNNLSPVQARTTKFGPEVQNNLVIKTYMFGGWLNWHVKFNLISKSCLFASLLRLWNISETRKNRMETESVPHSKWLRTNMFTHRVCNGPWNSRVVSLVWQLLASQYSTQRLAIDFFNASVGFRQIIHTSHAEILYANIQ